MVTTLCFPGQAEHGVEASPGFLPISIIGSSCNSLFIGIIFFYFSTYFFAFRPSFGLPVNMLKEKAKKQQNNVDK